MRRRWWRAMSAGIPLSFTVNGRLRTIDVEARTSLADALREECGLRGTHIGCEFGSCGTCTIILDGAAVRACMLLAVQAEGAVIETVEGLAGDDGALHPLQQAFMDNHALQCGFCTPGFLMLAKAFLAANPSATDAEIADMVSGNLCRCTGYANIVKAVAQAARMMANGDR